MIKKYALVLAALLCTFVSQAIIWQYDSYDAKKKTCRFSGWSGTQPSSGKLTIKETTEKDGVTYTVTAIAAGALNGLDKVTELTIPAGIATIAHNAGFHTMTDLTAIKVAEKNQTFSVHGGVLMSWSRVICLPQKSTVASVTLDDTRNIDSYAFFNCTNLQYINLSGTSLFTIGSYAFANTGITSIELPQGYEPREEVGILQNCKQLKKIRWSNQQNGIVVCKAFARNCRNLTEVTLYPRPQEIRQAAFKNCSSLSDFDFDAGVIMKEDSIFYNTAFTAVKFTGEASYLYRPLGAAMFSACANLESLDFSRVETDHYLKTLQLKSCFADNCPKLKTVEFPKYVATTCADDAASASFTFGRNTPVGKIVLYNLKIKNNYLVNYNVSSRTPAVYLRANTRDFDFAKDDFCDMKWFFKASDGAKVDASFYCAGIAPMMTGVCPYATYYIPWGHPGNYADAVAAGNNVYEMYSWTIKPENGVTTLHYYPAYSWAKCYQVIFNGTHSCMFPENNTATTTMGVDDMEYVRITTQVDNVLLDTEYTRAMFPTTSGADDAIGNDEDAHATVYNMSGVKVMEADCASPTCRISPPAYI